MNKKKIFLVIPGHLKTVPMNRYVYETFRELGYEVEIFDISADTLSKKTHKFLSREHFYRSVNQRLVQKVTAFSPDLFFTVFGFDILEESLLTLRANGIPTACWWLNDPFQITKSLKKAHLYDYYFTNSEGSLKTYRKEGIEKSAYLPVGIFPNVHTRLNLEKKYDVVFAGDYSPLREEILTEVSKQFDLAIMGPWKKLDPRSPLNHYIIHRGFFTPEEMNRFFNQAKIVLNIHTWMRTHEHGINPRVFEACGSGTLQLSDAKREIQSHYDIDREIVLYHDTTELLKKLKYFLEHESEREAIASAAFERSLRDHTYTDRITTMLHFIETDQQS